MNKSKLMLAALVAIPVSVGMVGEAVAEQTETLGDTLSTPVDINKAIEGLNTNSTRPELEKVKEAYNNLSLELRQQINNFGKVEVLLEDLEKKEAQIANRIAAEKVTEMIQTFNDEPTPAEISAARKAYDALNNEAKKLVDKRVVTNLEYFESRLAVQKAQAEKEAKVVVDRIKRIDKTKYTEAQIKSIRLAYNSLSDLAKSFVTNLNILIDGENYIIYQNTVVKQAKLDANAFDVYMNDISRSSTTQEIAKARSLYNNLSAEAKRHVTALEKLVRLETMWRDPDYIELVYTYYPDYIHEIKPGGVVIEKPTYDPLYIPDDSASTVATSIPKTANWSQYETMTYQNGRYTTQITASQVKNIADRNMRLKAGDIEIVIPTSEIQSSAATVGVSVNVTNNQLHIQFTEGNRTKTFESTVEIHIPVAKLKANTSQVIQRVLSTGTSPASFKVDGSKFIIRTVTGGTFKASNSRVIYTDIPNNDQGRAIRELTKRGIVFNTKSRLVQSYKQVSKLDAAVMIASALDVSSNNKSKYLDIANTQQLKLVQGLLEAGIMSGATSSRFAPNATVTKQEAAIIIANMYRYLNQDLAKAYNELNFSYSDIANLTLEARQSIAILELFGVVDGEGSFNPEKTLSRGEFAELIYNALIAIDYL
ncbi:MAG: S-layer homology domain-containing protein [Solibacillus isronensis]